MLRSLYRYVFTKVARAEQELYARAQALGGAPLKAPAGAVFRHLMSGIQYIVYGFLLFAVKFFVLIFKSPVEGYQLMVEPQMAPLSFAEYKTLHTKTRRFSYWTSGTILAAVVMVSLVLNLIVPAALPSLGATYTFVQTDWSSGATANNATHPTNQSSWNQYSSKSAEIITSAGGADLVIASTTGSVLKTSGADFTGGTFSNATTTNADTSIRLTTAAHVNEYTIGALSNVAATASSVTTNSNGTWTIAFSGAPNLARIFKNDKFTDSASKAWKVLSVFDSADKIIVVDSEANDTAPVTGAGTVGRWYASIYAWEAGREGNLVTRNAVERGLPYYDGAADTTAVTISGWTTDATHYVEILVPFSERHRGTWNAGKYNLAVTGSAALTNYANHIKIDGLQVSADDAAVQRMGMTFYQTGGVAGSAVLVSNNIVRATGIGGFAGIELRTAGTYQVWNNIVYDFINTSGIRTYDAGSTAYVYNNTVYNASSGIRITFAPATVVAKNNLVASVSGNDYDGSFASGSNYNVSSDATSTGGANDKINQTVSFADATNKDFHLQFNDAAAKNAGTDLSADANLAFSTDIDGDTRSGAWDIGADDVGAVLVMTHSIGTASRNFSTLQAWENARDGDLTTRKVFKIGGQSAAFTEGETITGGTSGATGTYIKERATPSASETFMTLDNATGTFQASETLTGGTSGSTATLSTILTTGGVVEKGEAYNDSVFSSGLDIDGSTTSSTRYMWLTAEPGSRHRGVAGTGVTVTGTPVNNRDDHTVVDWLEIKNITTTYAVSSFQLITRFSHLLIYGSESGIYHSTSAGGKIFSNIIYNNTAGSGWGIRAYGSAEVYNNTVYNSVRGIYNPSATDAMLARNNLSAGNSSGDYGQAGGGWDAAASHNSSSDATAPGSSSLASQSVAAVKFVSTSSGIEDLHIMNGSVAKDAGTSLSSTFTSDVDGQTRSGTWDIGADEWQSSSPLYNSSGTFESPTIDLNNTADFTTLSWAPASQVTNTTLQFQVATSSNGSSWPGPYVGSDGTSGTYLTASGAAVPSVLDGARYARFKAYVSTSDAAFSPRIDDVTLAYFQYATTSPSLTSSAYNSADATNILGKIAWTATTPSGTEVRMQMRSAPDSAGSPGTWSSWCGETACDGTDYFAAADNNIDLASAHPLKNGGNDQWLQYKAIFVSPGAVTPTLSDVTLTYVVNTPPGFDASYGGGTGVSVSQNTSDGQVVVNYRVRDVDTSTGTVTPGYITPSFAYSLDNSTFVNITSSYLAAGDLSNKAVQGGSYTQYSATWNAKGQINGTYDGTVYIRVTANDNEGANNSASAVSGAFALDVKNPAATVTVNGTASGQAGAISITSSDDSSYQMMASNNSDFSADGLNGASGQWVAAASSLTWTFASSEPVKVYIKFRDSYQNETSLSPDAPNTPTNVTIQDTSSLALSEFREFVSWSVSAAGDFASYKAYRSTNGTSYSLLSTIASASTNFLTDGSTGAWLSNGTTYYYKLTAQDASGNVSRYSSVVSDIPDGQGGTDVTAPTITSVAVSGILTTQATVTWTTDELSNSTVYYSTDTSYNSSTAVSSMVSAHSVTLTGLTPNTTYNIRVKSVDPLSNSAQADASSPGSNPVGSFSFTTAQGAVISSVSAIAVSGNSATIVWNTNQNSDSYVVYSTNADLSGSQTTGSATLVGGAGPLYEHRVVLTGLSTNVKYYYKVRSTNASSNLAENTNGGQYYTFTTVNDVTAPVISSVGASLASQTSAAIAWLTNELADSQVLYGTASGNLNQQTTVNATMTINHSVVLSNLTAGTTYYYKVVSADPQANSTTSSEYSFGTTLQDIIAVTRYVETTSVFLDKTAPLITAVAASGVTETSATVSWETNEDASSFAEYGRTEAYGTTVGQYGSTRRHKVTVSGLLPNTRYFFRARSHDASGNLSESAQAEFTTKAVSTMVDTVAQKAEEVKDAAALTAEVERLLVDLAGKVPPPQISGVEPKVSVTSSFAEIAWVTDRKANSMIAYAPEKDYLPSADEPYTLFAGNANESVTEHKVVLSNLLPGTLYHFHARSKGVVGGVGVSRDMTFRTKEDATISELAIRDVTKDSATIAWKTNIQTTSRVEYGLSIDYTLSQADNSLNTNHAVTLKGLQPATFYHFRAGGLDRQGSQFYSPDLTLTTESPPSLLDVKIDEVKEREMTIRWFTNVLSDSAVEYTNTLTGKTESINDKQLVKNHALTVEGLAQDTPYTFKVISRDEKGSEVTSSVYNLQTLKDIAQPFITAVQNQSAVSGKDRVQTIVSWKTSEPASTRVYWQEGVVQRPELERATPLESELTANHTVVFTNFKPGTAYRLRVESIDGSGNVAISRSFTILTPQQRETVFDLLLKNFQDVFKWTEKVF